ncbi:hypothetical protein BGZ63DRAFT_458528 [Mariannaea sp. PMI_226]|nr:hypothetical protein BGZ63DRAFT_458528 [Mariannaea sp. PMI_226]
MARFRLPRMPLTTIHLATLKRHVRDPSVTNCTSMDRAVAAQCDGRVHNEAYLFEYVYLQTWATGSKQRYWSIKQDDGRTTRPRGGEKAESRKSVYEREDQAWKQLQETFEHQERILRYLKNTYLPLKKEWACCYTRHYRNFGLITTAPAESNHHSLKTYHYPFGLTSLMSKKPQPVRQWINVSYIKTKYNKQAPPFGTSS